MLAAPIPVMMDGLTARRAQRLLGLAEDVSDMGANQCDHAQCRHRYQGNDYRVLIIPVPAPALYGGGGVFEALPRSPWTLDISGHCLYMRNVSWGSQVPWSIRAIQLSVVSCLELSVVSHPCRYRHHKA